jgi:hypothetical protein
VFGFPQRLIYLFYRKNEAFSMAFFNNFSCINITNNIMTRIPFLALATCHFRGNPILLGLIVFRRMRLSLWLIRFPTYASSPPFSLRGFGLAYPPFHPRETQSLVQREVSLFVGGDYFKAQRVSPYGSRYHPASSRLLILTHRHHDSDAFTSAQRLK